MRKFISENPTIAFGLGLPLVLVLVFLLVSGLPTLLVAAPQYDVLYTTNDRNYGNGAAGIQIIVLENRLQVNYLGTAQAYQNPRLWRYNPKTGAVKEIAISLPAGLKPANQSTANNEQALVVTPIAVPELEALSIDSSSLAPDGYQFSLGGDAYTRHGFSGLFYSARYGQQAELTKGGRSIRLPNTSGAYYGGSSRFIGWVVSP